MKLSGKPKEIDPIEYGLRNNSGFVLVTTLALLALAVVTVVVVTTLLRMKSDLIEAQANQQIARQNARIALDIAIGQLQYTTGNDRIVTAPAATLRSGSELENNHWTQAINSSTGDTNWLVSGSSTADPTAEQPITLVGTHTVGEGNDENQVSVPKVALQTLPNSRATDTQTTGYYGYWIGELNTRANIGLTDRISSTITDDNYELAYNQLSHPRRMATESILPSISNPDDEATLQQLNATEVPAQAFYIQQDRNELRENYHHFTTHSRSVLSNPIDGGLKINLTDPNYTDSIITQPIRDAISPDSYLEEETGVIDPNTYQVTGDDELHRFQMTDSPESGELLNLTQPLITEFCLSMGLFHAWGSRSGKSHRVKFHMHVEWLNPYPYDMKFRDSRPYIIMVDNLPTIEISNLSSGDSFEVNLNEVDEDLAYNKLNKKQINSWIEFDELSASPDTYGINAGSVYRMSDPDHKTDLDGITRTIQEEPYLWKYDSDGPPEDTPRPANMIYPDDEIRIRSVSSPVTMDVYVIPMLEDHYIDYDVTPREFLNNHGYVLKMTNIPFDSIDFTIRGSSYTRETTGSFSPADYRLAFHVKLKEESDQLIALQESTTVRNPVLDFSSPEISNLFETFNPVEEAHKSDPISDQLTTSGDEQIFWDDTHRENAADLNDDEYQFSLFDIPLLDPLSPGVLSQLHFHDKPHPWVGSPNAADTTFNEAYDRYYFSSNQKGDEWETILQNWTANSANARVLGNHRIRPLLKTDGTFPTAGTDANSAGEMNLSDAAKYSLMEGGFNIYSASEKAWTAFLRNQFKNNSALSITDGDGSADTTSGVFSRLPIGAANIDSQQADSAINNPTEKNKILYRQGIRALDSDSMIEDLASEIISQIETSFQGSGGSVPFTSLTNLINSGIIDNAIANVPEINEYIDPLSPGHLRQSDIFSLVGDQMTVRSDTFVIRSYGESTRSGETKAKAYCEAVVQRYPDYVIPTDDAGSSPSETLNIILGRRYRIVSFRWLQSQDI